MGGQATWKSWFFYSSEAATISRRRYFQQRFIISFWSWTTVSRHLRMRTCSNFSENSMWMDVNPVQNQCSLHLPDAPWCLIRTCEKKILSDLYEGTGNGERFVAFCSFHRLVNGDSSCTFHNISWISIDRQYTSYRIDHIAITSRFRGCLLDMHNKKGADIGLERDHALLVLLMNYVRIYSQRWKASTHFNDPATSDSRRNTCLIRRKTSWTARQKIQIWRKVNCRSGPEGSLYNLADGRKLEADSVRNWRFLLSLQVVANAIWLSSNATVNRHPGWSETWIRTEK